jgi:hypothetical protein
MKKMGKKKRWEESKQSEGETKGKSKEMELGAVLETTEN